MKSCTIPEYDVNEVVPNLWLGNRKSAYSKKFLDKYNIKYIITIMDEFDSKYRYNHIKYLVIPLKDVDTCQLNMIPIFEKTSNYINYILKKNEGVLVHCKNGHHRSASLVVAYMIRYLNTNYNATVKYIRYLRPCALRNRKCISDWLRKYYLQISNKQSFLYP